jgi:SPP1 gp7 family putative phage head morphogenesis protein
MDDQLMADPTDKEIFDQMLRHQVELERVSAYFVRDILSQLKEMSVEVAKEAALYGPEAAEQVIANIDGIIRNIYLRLTEEFRIDLQDVIAVEERAALWPWITAAGLGVTSGLTAPAMADVWLSPVQGSPWDSWWTRAADDTAREARQLVRGAAFRGVEPAAAIRRNLLPWARRRVEPLIRTTVAAITNRVKLWIYQLNPQLVPAIEWTAIIDNRTSALCRGLDGYRWRTSDKKPIGHTRAWPGPPPAHWRCRSTLTPTRNNAPANEQRYDRWLRDQPADVQLEVLGRTRYDMWRDGRISSVKDLTDQTNRPLQVDELKRKYGVN